jgi:hypothetical protein
MHLMAICCSIPHPDLSIRRRTPSVHHFWSSTALLISSAAICPSSAYKTVEMRQSATNESEKSFFIAVLFDDRRNPRQKYMMNEWGSVNKAQLVSCKPRTYFLSGCVQSRPNDRRMAGQSDVLCQALLECIASVNAQSLPLTSTVSTFSGVPLRFASIAADAALSAEPGTRILLSRLA